MAERPCKFWWVIVNGWQRDNRVQLIHGTSHDYELPAIGRPPDRPMLEKIAVEEHFDVLSGRPPRPDEDLAEPWCGRWTTTPAWMGIVGSV